MPYNAQTMADFIAYCDKYCGYSSEVPHRALLMSTPASVAQLDAPSDWRLGGRGFNSRRGRQHSFVEIDHEIFSTVILSLPSADSRTAVVSFWRKNVQNTG